MDPFPRYMVTLHRFTWPWHSICIIDLLQRWHVDGMRRPRNHGNGRFSRTDDHFPSPMSMRRRRPPSLPVWIYFSSEIFFISLHCCCMYVYIYLLLGAIRVGRRGGRLHSHVVAAAAAALAFSHRRPSIRTRLHSTGRLAFRTTPIDDDAMKNAPSQKDSQKLVRWGGLSMWIFFFHSFKSSVYRRASSIGVFMSDKERLSKHRRSPFPYVIQPQCVTPQFIYRYLYTYLFFIFLELGTLFRYSWLWFVQGERDVLPYRGHTHRDGTFSRCFFSRRHRRRWLRGFCPFSHCVIALLSI